MGRSPPRPKKESSVASEYLTAGAIVADLEAGSDDPDGDGPDDAPPGDDDGSGYDDPVPGAVVAAVALVETSADAGSDGPSGAQDVGHRRDRGRSQRSERAEAAKAAKAARREKKARAAAERAEAKAAARAERAERKAAERAERERSEAAQREQDEQQRRKREEAEASARERAEQERREADESRERESSGRREAEQALEEKARRREEAKAAAIAALASPPGVTVRTRVEDPSRPESGRAAPEEPSAPSGPDDATSVSSPTGATDALTLRRERAAERLAQRKAALEAKAERSDRRSSRAGSREERRSSRRPGDADDAETSADEPDEAGRSEGDEPSPEHDAASSTAGAGAAAEHVGGAPGAEATGSASGAVGPAGDAGGPDEAAVDEEARHDDPTPDGPADPVRDEPGPADAEAVVEERDGTVLFTSTEPETEPEVEPGPEAQTDDRRADDVDVPEPPSVPRERSRPSVGAILQGVASLVAVLAFLASVLLAASALMLGAGIADAGTPATLYGLSDALSSPVGGIVTFAGEDADLRNAFAAYGIGSLVYLGLAFGVPKVVRTLVAR